MADVIRLRVQQEAQQATVGDLGALLLAAGTLSGLAVRMRERISQDGPHGELYDQLTVACDDREAGTPAALAGLAAELMRQATP